MASRTTGPDMGLVPAQDLSSLIGGPDMGGFAAQAFQPAQGVDMGGFPAYNDRFFQYVVLLCHWSGSDKQVISGAGINGWDTSPYHHATGSGSNACRLNGQGIGSNNPWGNRTVSDGSIGTPGSGAQFTSSTPELIVGLQDFCIEAQVQFNTLGNGAGNYTGMGQRNTAFSPTSGSWWIGFSHNGGTTTTSLPVVALFVNDVLVQSYTFDIVPGTGGTPAYDLTGRTPANTIVSQRWCHIAYSRTGATSGNGKGYLHIDSILGGTGSITNGLVITDNNNYSANTGIGCPLFTGLTNGFLGYFTEFRLTVGPEGSGAARYAGLQTIPKQIARWPDG